MCLFFVFKRFFNEECNLLYLKIKFLVRLMVLLWFFLFFSFERVFSFLGKGIFLYKDEFNGGFLKIIGFSFVSEVDMIFFFVIN